MASDERLLARVKMAISAEKGVSERRMFGGVCFMINGDMACGVEKNDLVVRVGPDAHEAALKKRFARPMDFTGRPMKGFVYVAEDGVRTDRDLRAWVLQGVKFARSLPAKRPGK